MYITLINTTIISDCKKCVGKSIKVFNLLWKNERYVRFQIYFLFFCFIMIFFIKQNNNNLWTIIKKYNVISIIIGIMYLCYSLKTIKSILYSYNIVYKFLELELSLISSENKKQLLITEQINWIKKGYLSLSDQKDSLEKKLAMELHSLLILRKNKESIIELLINLQKNINFNFTKEEIEKYFFDYCFSDKLSMGTKMLATMYFEDLPSLEQISESKIQEGWQNLFSQYIVFLGQQKIFNVKLEDFDKEFNIRPIIAAQFYTKNNMPKLSINQETLQEELELAKKHNNFIEIIVLQNILNDYKKSTEALFQCQLSKK